ncbi:MAG TPA: hypothetical protein VLC55_14025, partial [Burkholderiales bacterium]|nr:hypothetical protein [Burkholderiales bacterium]
MDRDELVEEPGAEKELLEQADALMHRHRGFAPATAGPAAAPAPPAPKPEIPVLTEVVDGPVTVAQREAAPKNLDRPVTPPRLAETVREEAPRASPADDREALAREVFEEALRQMEGRISETIEQQLSPQLVSLLANSMA